MNPALYAIEIAVAVLALIATVAIPVISYVIRGINKRIDASESTARDMHISAKGYVQEAEARMAAQVRECEARADRGDDRLLGVFNSNMGEVNRQLGEIRRMLAEDRTRVAKA